MRKAYDDVDETKHNKRKSEKNEGRNTARKRTTGKNNNRNVCHHHGTQPSSKCSLNPQGKNYHINRAAPFIVVVEIQAEETDNEVDFKAGGAAETYVDKGAPLNSNITYTMAVAEVITLSMIAVAIMAKMKYPLATTTTTTPTTVTACPQTNTMITTAT